MPDFELIIARALQLHEALTEREIDRHLAGELERRGEIVVRIDGHACPRPPLALLPRARGLVRLVAGPPPVHCEAGQRLTLNSAATW